MTQQLEILEQMKIALDDAYAAGVRNSQRTWVGLTDEEMHDCWDSPLTPLGMKHVRMIEAKLKEKNGYAEEKNT